MIISLIIFYSIIVVLLLSVYLLYPVLVQIISKVNQESGEFESNFDGNCYVLISAYNEEDVIVQKLENLIQHRVYNFEIYVISDASEDRTGELVSEYAVKHDFIHFMVSNGRLGKNACLNQLYDSIKPNDDDILIFTDANTYFNENSIPELVKTIKQGSDFVAGSMVYIDEETNTAKSEGLYWKYEEWIRRNEGFMGRLITANGGIFAVRAEHYEQWQPNVPNDFEMPLRLLGSGFRTRFNENAKGFEKSVSTSDEEQQRKIRMANRQMNAIIQTWGRLNLSTRVQVLLRKVFRWLGMHLFYLSSIIILILYFLTSGHIIIIIFTLLHISVFIALFISLIMIKIGITNKITSAIYHAALVHHAGAKGVFLSLSGTSISTWEKAKSNRI